MKEAKRILHVFGRMDRGGAEMRTLELFSELASDGIRFDFATLSEEQGDLDSQIFQLGGKVYPFNPGPGFLIHFWRLLKREHFSAVHSHLHLFSGLILLLARLAGVQQRIAHFRSTGDGRPKTALRQFRNWCLLKLVLKTITHGIGVSKASLDLAIGGNWKSDPRFQVIYSGIPIDLFREKQDRRGVLREFAFEPNSKLVIHVGRMAREKNHLMLVEIFSELARLDPQVKLLIVGRREYEIQTAIEERAAVLNLSSKIRMVGTRTDVPRLMASSDLMIFPSLREGLPGAVVEAAAAGIPILASKIPGIEELEEHLRHIQLESPHSPANIWALKAMAMLNEEIRTQAFAHGIPEWLNSSRCAKTFAFLYADTTGQKARHTCRERSIHV